MNTLWLDATEFQRGGWQLETQFVRSMGCSYLIASGVPGVPVEDATATFSVSEDGLYRFFVYTKNWKVPEAPGRFSLVVDGVENGHVCEAMPAGGWYFEIAADLPLKKGKHTVALHDVTGWLSRCGAVIITNDDGFYPSRELPRMKAQRAAVKGLTGQKPKRRKFDFVVVGAGPGGVPAAVSAARQGLKVALLCGRPGVGGNASHEGLVGLDGASSNHRYWHETGINNEIKIYHESGLSWQQAMEKMIAGEKNLTVFYNELCIDATVKDSHIQSVLSVNTLTLEETVFTAPFFADCTGDGWLGYYAGAAYTQGREGKVRYGEELATELPDGMTMSGCISQTAFGHPMRSFRAEEDTVERPFILPDWAIHLPKGEEGLHRKADGFSGSDWWMENSQDFDDTFDDELVRDELIRLAVGYFGWLKETYPEASKYYLTALPLYNAKRENRRLLGDYILTMADYDRKEPMEDAVTYAGWCLDLHHPKGIYSGEEGPFFANAIKPIIDIPYRCLYSRNIDNLFMAGRNISVSHVMLGTCRVEATIATEGQIIGAAAAYCLENNLTPRGIYQKKMQDFRQLLLKEDITIRGLVNTDKKDLALTSTVEADGTADGVMISCLPGIACGTISLENTVIASPAGRFVRVPEYIKVILHNTGRKEQTVTAVSYDNYDAKVGPSTLCDTCTVTLPAGFYGLVTLPFSVLPSAKNWALALTADKTVVWEKRKPVKGLLLLQTLTDGQVSAKADGVQMFWTSEFDTFVPCGADLLIGHTTRQTSNSDAAWVSDPGLPKSVTYTLKKPSEVRQVQILCDVDLSYPAFSFHRAPRYEGTATDLTVSVLYDGQWKVAGKVKNNHHRMVRVNFKPTKAEKVKVTVNATTGAPYAKLYEVRIYG